MKHKHCFAVKVDCKEDEGRNSVDSHCVAGKFNGSCDNIDPHVSDEMVGHVVVAGFICIFCVVGSHKIKKYAECSFRKKSNKMIKFAPEHNERSGGAYHCGHDGKGKAAGFSMEKSRRVPTSCQIRSSGASIRHIPTIIGRVPLSLSWSFFIL